MTPAQRFLAITGTTLLFLLIGIGIVALKAQSGIVFGPDFTSYPVGWAIAGFFFAVVGVTISGGTRKP
jgi:hypothetical protein